MNIIVFSKRLGRARQFELGRPRAMTVTIASVAMLLGGVMFAGVQLGRSGVLDDPAEQFGEWNARLEQQSAEVANTRRELQQRLDALAGLDLLA